MAVDVKEASAPWVGPEVDLLFCACAVGDRAARMERFHSIVATQSVDWEYLSRIAEHNRVVPTLQEAIEGCPPDSVPAEVRDSLEAAARAIKLQNLVMMHELIEVVQLLESRGVRTVQLKGPVLAAEFYDNPTSRHYRDLDILVARSDVERAKKALLDRGYEPSDAMTAKEEARALRDDCELEFDLRRRRIRLELHWDVLPRRHARRFELQALEERTVSVGGAVFRTFALEDLFLYLCVHGGDKHLWVRLKWLCDLAHVLTVKRDLDWERLMARAAAVEREDAVLLGVYLAWLLLDAPLSDAVVEKALARPAVVARAGLVHGRLFRLPSRMPSYREWRRDLRAAEEVIRERGFERRVDDGWRRYVQTILTPDWTDRQALGFPRFLSFLYFVHRPLRLVRKHRGDVVRHV